VIIVTKVILIINDSESESSSSISTDSELNDYEEDQNIFNDDTEINTANKKKTSFIIHDPEPNISRVISRDIAVNHHNIKLSEHIFMFIDVKEGIPIESTPTKQFQYDKTTNFLK
jgi:hypothetical protein